MFSMMKQWLVNLYQDEEGASAIEYALIAAMVALVIATMTTDIGGKIRNIFTAIDTALTTTGSGS